VGRRDSFPDAKNDTRRDRINELNYVKSESRHKTHSGRPVTRVGDALTPEDTPVIAKKKKNNVAGWLIAFAVCIAVIIVVATNVISDKTEDQPVLITQSESINLPALAEQHYGNSIFWVYIYQANQDKLTSPVNIPKNVEITIPDLVEFDVDINDSMEIKRANILSDIILKQIKK
jgi:hypothetical protein